ncbi:hypothetical protein N9O61_03595 [Octadecabacter sp.]|nr:hypothetical protein [Octadecabacter sp.]
MGSYFAERFDAILGLPAAILQAPVFFIVIFAIGGLLIWLKYRIIGRSMNKAIQSTTHGLRVSGDQKQVRHETGVGTTNVIVMRPGVSVKGLIFGVLFFGSGAVFYVLVVLQSPDVASKDWWTFAGLTFFTIAAIAAIEASMTRIYVSEAGLERRRVLHRRQTILFSDVAAVGPIGKSFQQGLVVQSKTAGKMRIPAAFSGYRDLLNRLRATNNVPRFASHPINRQQVR